VSPRYEARAVWRDSDGYYLSQPLPAFDHVPLRADAPVWYSVYSVEGGNVNDYAERADAERHAGELNGAKS
jgi:hypothetical protein